MRDATATTDEYRSCTTRVSVVLGRWRLASSSPTRFASSTSARAARANLLGETLNCRYAARFTSCRSIQSPAAQRKGASWNRLPSIWIRYRSQARIDTPGGGRPVPLGKWSRNTSKNQAGSRSSSGVLSYISTNFLPFSSAIFSSGVSACIQAGGGRAAEPADESLSDASSVSLSMASTCSRNLNAAYCLRSSSLMVSSCRLSDMWKPWSSISGNSSSESLSASLAGSGAEGGALDEAPLSGGVVAVAAPLLEDTAGSSR